MAAQQSLGIARRSVLDRALLECTRHNPLMRSVGPCSSGVKDLDQAWPNPCPRQCFDQREGANVFFLAMFQRNSGTRSKKTYLPGRGDSGHAGYT